VFLNEFMFTKGRRTDLNGNAFWAAAAALVPEGVCGFWTSATRWAFFAAPPLRPALLFCSRPFVFLVNRRPFFSPVLSTRC
jgi:hypothetical protein